jgi:PAS domain S-box-containing protein
MTELADLLESQFDPLLTRWMARVAESVPGPEGGAARARHMPAFLRRMIATLRHPAGAAGTGLGGAGGWYFGEAFEPRFELDAVAREYGLLVHLVLDVVETSGAEFPLRDLRRFHDLMTDTLAEAAARYQRRMSAFSPPPDGAIPGNVELSEDALRTLSRVIPQQIWTATPQGALDFVNERASGYFGLSQEKVLGQGWRGVIHPDDLARCTERWAHSLRTGDEYEVEFRLRRGDASYRWHLGRAVAVRDAAGTIVKWFGTNTDIDELKRVRDELEKRTQFEQHLAGVVSHDLRNPLAVILMSAKSLLRLEPQSETTARTARRIQAAAERSARMIADLLDFTQARLGGGLRVQRRAADLYLLAGAAADDAAAACPDREVEVHRSGDTTGTWDTERLGQAVANLTTNALKYSPPATPVAIHVEGFDEVVEFRIHNHGAPIAPERLDRVFEPLQRASDDTDRASRSLGLGLYIVDAIVRAHGGSVSVVSTAADGTTFIVRLPRS